MTLEGAHASLWLATADLPASEGILRGSAEADVVVVGGGIVGITAAYLLSREGRSVVLLERDRLLHGVTGHTTAKVCSQHGVVYSKLVERFGEAKARLYGEANEAAKETIARLAHETGADARFTRAPNYVYTTSASQVARLREEAEVSARLGLPASFTTQTELPFPVAGAVRFEDQAHFHPVRYLERLAQRARDAGCRIHEGTMVTGIEEGEPSRVTTELGSVTAKHVLVATNVPVMDKAFFVTRMEPKREYALAARHEGAPIQGMYVSADSPRRSVRPYGDEGRRMLVFAGESHAVGERDHDDHYANLSAFAREGFGVTSIEYRWSTQDYYSVDELALIGRYTPVAKRTFAATGFRAWGMTQGTLAAQMVTDWVMGRSNPYTDLYDPYAPGRVMGDVASKEFVKLQAHVTKEFVGERLARHPGTPVADLAPGEGRIVDAGLRKLAVCRDADGTVRTFSATCTHMGCVVAWNPHEKSWDCPCHGSRFGTDGRVLHGPAVKPLEPADTP